MIMVPMTRALFKSDRFTPNLYCNKMGSLVPDGWIMYLDDDDMFMNSTAVSAIMNAVTSEDDLLIWRVQFPNNRIIPKRPGKKPKLGDISAIGFAFHKKHWHEKLWDDRKGSDYRAVMRLWSTGLNPIWIDDILTGINYKKPREVGTGQRLDMSEEEMLDPVGYRIFNERRDHNDSHSSKMTAPKKIKIQVKRVEKTPVQVQAQVQEPHVQDGEQEYVQDGEQEYVQDGGEQEYVQDGEQEYVQVGGEQEYVQDGEQEYIQDGEQEYVQDGEQEYVQDGEQEYVQVGGEQEYVQDGEQEYVQDGEQEYVQDGEQEYVQDGGEQEYVQDGGEQEYVQDGGEQEYVQDGGEQEYVQDGGEQEYEPECGQEEHPGEDETEFSIGDDDEFEEIQELHPQVTKLLDILTSDGKVFVLREDDLKNIFIRTLKMQGMMIEQIGGVRELVENLTEEVEALQVKVNASSKRPSPKIGVNGSSNRSSANELLQTLDGNGNSSAKPGAKSSAKSEKARPRNGRISLRRGAVNKKKAQKPGHARGNIEDELEQLLSCYGQSKETDSVNENDNDNGPECDGEMDIDTEQLRANLGAFFHRIYVLDMTNKANDLAQRLQDLGFDNLEIVSWSGSKGMVDALPNLISKAKKEGHERIMVLKDNLLIHKNIITELAQQLSTLKDKARVLYMGSSYTRTKNHQAFDPQFYMDTYEDLEKAGINTVEKAQKHWKTSGHRQGRWGSRHISHPEIVKDLSAICIHMDVFDVLVQSMAGGKRKGEQSYKTFEKAAAEVVYALTPPPFMNELNKYNRAKNRCNAFLYA